MNPHQTHGRRALPLACLAALSLLLLTLAGCGRTERVASPSFGGTLVIAGQNDLDFANSLVSREAFTQDLILNALFLPLVRHAPDLSYEPRLARSWEMIGDSAIIFRLREDVEWHDGVPTTAHDVAFTYNRALDPETAFSNRREFEHWGAAEVIDSFTIRFQLEPHADPLAPWTALAIMPSHLLDTIPPARLQQAEFNRSPVGNGPFRFVSSSPNDRWTFAANEDFPAELGGRPRLDRFVWRVIPESTVRDTELLTRNVDLALGVAARELAELGSNPGIRTLVRPSQKYQALIWNGKRRPFNDPRVRRAMSLAIDRGEILEALRGGYGQLATGPVFPGHWAFDSTLAPLPFDTVAARELLAEAGFEKRGDRRYIEDQEGRALEFDLSVPAGNPYSRNVAEVVQAQLARIGVAVSVRVLEFSTLVDHITKPQREFDGVFLAWTSGVRLDMGDLFHSDAIGGQFQFASYQNPEVDSILDSVAQLERDQAIPLWHRLQRIFLEEQPWTFFYYTPDLAAINDKVKGVELDIRGIFVGLPEWWKDNEN